jgi:hypothetical protein
MMKFETKWLWFKRFALLTALLSGVTIVKSIVEGDYVLFIAGLGLGLGAMGYQMIIGFIDALLKETS